MTRLLPGILIFLLSASCLAAPDHTHANQAEKDASGRAWILKGWKDGTRPYPQDLGEREKWYQKKRGESWYGPQVAQRIYTPGSWNWEVYHSLPASLAERLRRIEGKKYPWGFYYKIMTFVWAPGGGKVTDVYVAANSTFYHYDVLSGKGRFIGDPEKKGDADGVMEKALLNLREKDAALDQVTGRLFFSQKSGKRKALRFVEKLLPYRCSKTNKTFYLPAVLDTEKLYQRVKSPSGGELAPLFEDGKRGEAVLVVRTNSAVPVYDVPGANRGRRLLITPDGEGIYYAKGWRAGTDWWLETLYDRTSLFDLDTGNTVGRLRIKGTVPENYKSGDAPGTHGGNNVGYDGLIYTSQHGGAGGGGGRLFSIDPESGKVTMLYDSMPEDKPWRKVRTAVFDGPADATSLWFTSTLYQTQCPRTGAIINGGWDGHGIRRYLDGFVTTVAGHYIGGFHQPARPGWSMGFMNVHHNSNPAVAPDGDLYLADVNSDVPRIVRIYRTDWPEEQPVNGYAWKFLSRERRHELMLEYARTYIRNYAGNSRLLNGRQGMK